MKRVHVVPRLRARIAALGVRHLDVAHQLRIHPSLLSAFLNERRELTSDFDFQGLSPLCAGGQDHEALA